MANELPEEYLEYLRQHVSRLESIGDKFSGADERLDYAVQQMVAIKEKISQIDITPETISTLERLTALLEELKEVGFTMPTQGRSVPLYAEVAPLDVVKVTGYSPLKGKIRQVSISWPDGSDFVVLVAFGKGSNTWLIPDEPQTFERNNDVTVTYPIDEAIEHNEELWLIIRNGDLGNAHQISATAIIVGEA